MWELYVDGQYVDCYSSKWDAVAAARSLPDDVDWFVEYFPGS